MIYIIYLYRAQGSPLEVLLGTPFAPSPKTGQFRDRPHLAGIDVKGDVDPSYVGNCIRNDPRKGRDLHSYDPLL